MFLDFISREFDGTNALYYSLIQSLSPAQNVYFQITKAKNKDCSEKYQHNLIPVFVYRVNIYIRHCRSLILIPDLSLSNISRASPCVIGVADLLRRSQGIHRIPIYLQAASWITICLQSARRPVGLELGTYDP
jgi:hypothetical protein